MIRAISIFNILLFVFFTSCSSNDDEEELGIQETEKSEAIIEPVLKEVEVVNITETSVMIKGKIEDDGHGTIKERGVVWSESEDFTQVNEKLATAVKGSGEFSVEINGLIEDTEYYLKAFAKNELGNGYSLPASFKTKAVIKPIVYIDESSFSSLENFNKDWNMLYPWGADHNGSARMFEENVNLNDGVLQIHSEWIDWAWEGYSTADPHLRITFHSGAVHAKQKIQVTEELPDWEISGDFKAPTAPSSWPAFWITGVDSWPPEIDILEFKGTTSNLQNTVTGPSWDQTVWTTVYTDIPDASSEWHNYKLTMRRIDDVETEVKMFIDDQLRSSEIKDFTNDRFWLIINMQMEGASGTTNDNSLVRSESQIFSAKNIHVSATPGAEN
ncbi:hypothetical protein [Zunongwangia pacifica]|uniref:GH16 domain-containing protein n=1 Tax=Zunongwangia pacifica TaxID=2911062 RepID=A0A9X1ZTL3_9FLAO|nr:hypothetical protein [Zunongwangia pacifica]MCL6218203.1 hypothetical protein [Zunongwangia pacifica]